MEVKLIEYSIIQFLQNNILAENVSISADTVLNDIGIDSYSIVEIVLFIERHYGFIIPDDDLKPENFKTVNSVAILINDHLTK